MLNTREKVDAIKLLKNYVVKSQKYELAAWLRDIEKKNLDELSLPYTSNYGDDSIKLIRYPQYLYLIELLDSFYSIRYPNSPEIDLIKEKLKAECIDIIREQKLDELFGDSGSI